MNLVFQTFPSKLSCPQLLGGSVNRYRLTAQAQLALHPPERIAQFERRLLWDIARFDQGIQSLSRKEKKILSRATQRQQEHDRRAGRIDRL